VPSPLEHRLCAPAPDCDAVTDPGLSDLETQTGQGDRFATEDELPVAASPRPPDPGEFRYPAPWKLSGAERRPGRKPALSLAQISQIRAVTGDSVYEPASRSYRRGCAPRRGQTLITHRECA
jgi:hypothetical protein